MSPATGSPARKTQCSAEWHVPSVGEIPRLMQFHPAAATASKSYHRAATAKRRGCETFRAMWDRTPPPAGVLKIGNQACTCGARRTRPQMDHVWKHRRRRRNHSDAHPDRRAPARSRITPGSRRTAAVRDRAALSGLVRLANSGDNHDPAEKDGRWPLGHRRGIRRADSNHRAGILRILTRNRPLRADRSSGCVCRR